jgi:hypothetical protein
MARNTPNIILKVWDLLSDRFNHTELAANWDAIDAHDHTAGKGTQIPTGGLANSSVIDTKLASNAVTTTKIADSNVTGAKIATGAIDGSKIVDGTLTNAKISDGTLAGDKMAASVFSPYQTIATAWAQAFTGDVSSGGGAIYVPGTATGGLTVRQAGAFQTFNFHIIAFDPADHLVTGKTAKFRLLVGTSAGTAPGSNLTYGLYPVSAIGGSAQNVNVTLGSPVAGSTVTRTAPATAAYRDTSSEFVAPSAGQYMFGFANSTAWSASSNVSWTWSLQVHWI